MKRNLYRLISILLFIVAAAAGVSLLLVPASLGAQGYSGAAPNVTKTASTGLGLTYSNGTIVAGGKQTSITGSTLTASNSQTDCQAPGYASCNFVYWSGGSSLAITTDYATAFSSGNVIVAFVTASGGNISVITPASWNIARPDALASAYTDGAYFIGPSACNSSVSGNSTGTNGFTVLGTAPSIAAVQAQTSASGTNLHYYRCNITPPFRTTSGRGITITDVVFFYGVQTTALTTQSATLASGTLNSQTVFTYIDYPSPGSNEVATGVANATRADSGTLTMLPTTGAFNSATTTSGAFYSVKFTPASGIAVATDLRQYYLTVGLQNLAASATVTNSPGVLVHFTNRVF